MKDGREGLDRRTKMPRTEAWAAHIRHMKEQEYMGHENSVEQTQKAEVRQTKGKVLVDSQVKDTKIVHVSTSMS